MLMVPNPIPMILHCPTCKEQHVCADHGCTPERAVASTWRDTLHTCTCGRQFMPCEYPTRGVRSLHGYLAAPGI